MTFIYYKKPHEFADLALAYIRNETENPIIEVTSEHVADALRLEPGKFYCYYKPSFVNQNGSLPSEYE